MRENPQLNILPDFKKTTWVGFVPSWPPPSYSIDNKQRHLTSDDQISKTTINGSISCQVHYWLHHIKHLWLSMCSIANRWLMHKITRHHTADMVNESCYKIYVYPAPWYNPNGIHFPYITPSELETLAMDRAGWRFTCKSAVEEFEVQRIQESEAKRDLRKSGPPSTSNFECQICHGMCRSRIGLLAHNKSHSWWWDPSYRRLSRW